MILGVIGSDVHVIGNRLLEHALREAGFTVENLGIQVAQEDFIRAAIETNAGAILVSSLYGHAALDCEGFPSKCVESGIGDVLLYLGGNLSVGKRSFEADEDLFLSMGFDRVFPPTVGIEDAIHSLKSDLGLLDVAEDGPALSQEEG